MATISARLAALEQTQRKARPLLVIVLRPEQEGEPTPEQAAQIEQAKREGRPVKVIRYSIV